MTGHAAPSDFPSQTEAASCWGKGSKPRCLQLGQETGLAEAGAAPMCVCGGGRGVHKPPPPGAQVLPVVEQVTLPPRAQAPGHSHYHQGQRKTLWRGGPQRRRRAGAEQEYWEPGPQLRTWAHWRHLNPELVSWVWDSVGPTPHTQPSGHRRAHLQA